MGSSVDRQAGEYKLVTIKPERILESCTERGKMGGIGLTLLAEQLNYPGIGGCCSSEQDVSSARSFEYDVGFSRFQVSLRRPLR